MGPDILIATHSTEIITEAETDDIVLVNKQRRTATRIRNPSQLEEVFRLLGSNLNPILTQLAKTRRAIFVEGKDFQVISKFAQKLRRPKVGNRSEFAVIPVEAFSPERIRSLKLGMEMTLGGKILAAAVLDKDYRSKSECNAIKSQCMSFCDAVVIHNRKEMENFLLVPSAIDRAAKRRLIDRKARTNSKEEYESTAEEILDKFAARKRSYVVAQYISCRRNFERAKSSKLDESKIAESVIEEVERVWESLASRLDIVPGKEALSAINDQLQKQYKVSITATAIVDAMRADEIPEEMKRLVESIDSFAMLKIGSNIGDE